MDQKIDIEEKATYSGIEYIFQYTETENIEALPYNDCSQVYAVCYVGNKIAIVHNKKSDTWGLIGGSIERAKKESYLETLEREIHEEGNLKLIKAKPFGYQKVVNTQDDSFVYQLRYVCTAELYGKFESDPDGSIDRMELINPIDYKKYFDWGEIGERIIKRGAELIKKLL